MSKLIYADSQALQSYRDNFEVEFKRDRQEMESVSLSLDKDATSKSPEALYKKLYLAREYTNRAGVMYSKYIKLQLLSKKLLLQKTEERRVKLAAIFKDNIDVVSKFRSGEEKNKYCESLLDEEFESTFISAKMLAEEASGYLQYFRLQFDLYKEIKSDILTQLGIIRSMLMLGELPLINNINGIVNEVDVDRSSDSDIIGEGTVKI